SRLAPAARLPEEHRRADPGDPRRLLLSPAGLADPDRRGAGARDRGRDRGHRGAGQADPGAHLRLGSGGDRPLLRNRRRERDRDPVRAPEQPGAHGFPSRLLLLRRGAALSRDQLLAAARRLEPPFLGGDLTPKYRDPLRALFAHLLRTALAAGFGREGEIHLAFIAPTPERSWRAGQGALFDRVLTEVRQELAP